MKEIRNNKVSTENSYNLKTNILNSIMIEGLLKQLKPCYHKFLKIESKMLSISIKDLQI